MDSAPERKAEKCLQAELDIPKMFVAQSKLILLISTFQHPLAEMYISLVTLSFLWCSVCYNIVSNSRSTKHNRSVGVKYKRDINFSLLSSIQISQHGKLLLMKFGKKDFGNQNSDILLRHDLGITISFSIWMLAATWMSRSWFPVSKA